jgi:uncharacterized membrane protein YeaQ/YmgE (transglycosylase-associated protein family)
VRPAGPVETGGRRALAFVVAGGVLLLFIGPYALVLMVLGFVAGIQALRKASRSGGTAPGAVAAIVLGTIGTAIGCLLLLVYLLLRTEIDTYQECIAGANTGTAERTCRDQLEDDLSERFGVDLRSARPGAAVLPQRPAGEN